MGTSGFSPGTWRLRRGFACRGRAISAAQAGFPVNFAGPPEANLARRPPKHRGKNAGHRPPGPPTADNRWLMPHRPAAQTPHLDSSMHSCSGGVRAKCAARRQGRNTRVGRERTRRARNAVPCEMLRISAKWTKRFVNLGDWQRRTRPDAAASRPKSRPGSVLLNRSAGDGEKVLAGQLW